jgi:DNA polymerase-3 subunit delta
MPRTAAKSPAPLAFIFGEDDFAAKQRAKQLYLDWTTELGGMDHESIDASVSNSNEALRALAKLREALQTLPFFGAGKVVWFKDCNFLADERTALAQAVTDALTGLAQELKQFPFDKVRLIISAGKVDKRRTFYKTLEKLGTVENFAGWSVDDRNWADQAELWARKALRERGKEISDEAVAELVSRVGPNPRQMDSEVEKLSLYAAEKKEVEFQDVVAICSRNKMARAFALGDALGDRDLPRLLQRLDEELWEVRLDRGRSEIGLLYGLISKVRAMILLKEMMREGWVKPAIDFGRFKAQLERVPADKLPQDKRFNPLAVNPYVLFKALPQVQRYSQEELARAMELLFRCNQKLVTSGLEESLVLQQTLVQIVGSGATAAA